MAAAVRKGAQVRVSNLPGTVKVIEMSADGNWARVHATDGDPGWRHVSILTVVPHIRKSRAKTDTDIEMPPQADISSS